MLQLVILLFFMVNAMQAEPFSFTEIQKTPFFILKKPSFITVPDNCKLAYYAFMPDTPKALVLFYTGAGLYGNRIHQWIAKELQEQYNIGTYIIDIRGHGNSGGSRGDAPTIDAVWSDISMMIDHVRHQYPDIPLYLAGHSSGAGLLLNYAARYEHRLVDGMILLAPYLGPRSGALKEHQNPEQKFAKKIRTWVYIMAGMSNGRFAAHIPAVYFNYPDWVFEDEKILKYYTYTMSQATTPYQTLTIFRSVEIPTALFIAAADEQFIADAIASYADYIPSSVYRYTEIVPHTKHLTILLQAPSIIAHMIDRFALHAKM